MSSQLKRENDALRAKLLQMQTEAAAAGIPISSGGLDLMTGQRVPAVKFLGLEFGDATPYAERRDSLLQEMTNIGQQKASAERKQYEKRNEDSKNLFNTILAQSSTGNIKDSLDALKEFRYGTYDLDRQEADEAVNRSIYQSQMQLASAMPYLNEAARVATERNLDASQRFLDFKERMPTAVQNRMLAGSTAYAQNLQGVAAAANAAGSMILPTRRFG